MSQRIPHVQSRRLGRPRACWSAALRALGLVFVLLVSIGSPVRSFALFRCAYTGVARSACCCPAHEQMEGAALSQSCCCSIERVDASLPAGNVGHDKVAPLAFAPLALPPAPSLVPRALRIAYAPPALRPLRHVVETRAGPPLIIVHRRLLL